MKKILFSIAFFILFVVFLIPGKANAATSSTLLPISDGFYTQFTPSSGTSHFGLVDETTCNGNTDYVHTTIFGNRDSFAVSLATIPDNSTITQISITPCASKKSNGGANSIMYVFYRLNGVNSASAGNYSMSGSTPTQLATTNFSGLNITKTASTSVEIGASFSSGSKGMKLSRISSVITYTPPATPSPSVTTNDATNLGVIGSSASANLNSTVNPNGALTTVFYKYGTVNTSCSTLGNQTPAVSIGSGVSDVSPNTRSIGFLPTNTTFYFCAVGTSANGTTYGNVLSFTTLP